MLRLNNLVGFGVGGGYTIRNSGLFVQSESDHLSRTPGGASNQQKWTWHGMIKRVSIGSAQSLFAAGVSSSDFSGLYFDASDNLKWWDYPSASNGRLYSTATFTSTSVWYPLTMIYDSAQAASADRVKLYDGDTLLSVTTDTAVPLNRSSDINSTYEHNLGRLVSGFWDADQYMVNVHFIDGQALDPSNFGDMVGSDWVPKRYSGSYGTNGFKLNFENGADLGEDSSGNGNGYTNTGVTQTAVVP